MYLTPEDQQSLFQNWLEWLCKSCLLYIFPFNNFIDDKDFVAAVNCIDKAATLNDSDLIFHPFEIYDTDHASPLCEIDPDVHFYNSIDTYLSKCNYFDEYVLRKLYPIWPNQMVHCLSAIWA